MQNQRAQNLQDAWLHGGNFEGKPATDDVLLAFWRDRLKGIDPKDPLYDTYSNTVMQLDYSIHESKISLAYAQGKISAGEVAQFYLDWAKKVPQDSEFYRVLQRDAAQFLRAAKAASGGGGGGGGRGGGGGGSSASAKAAAYAASQLATYNKYEQLGNYMLTLVRDIGVSRGLIPVGGDFKDMFTQGPAQLDAVLKAISQGGSNTIYTLNTGEHITADGILATIRQLDPRFNGQLTLDYFKAALRAQYTGLLIRQADAQATNHKTDANAIAKDLGYVTETGREAGIWSAFEVYANDRQQFLRVWQDPTAAPTEKLAAFQKYQQQLTGLATDPSLGLDDNTISRLLAEANGDPSKQSLAEDMIGTSKKDLFNPETNTYAGDIAGTWGDVQRFSNFIQAVDSGQAQWVFGSYDAQGNFKPQAGGISIGAATVHDINVASPIPPQTFLADGGGRTTLPVAVIGAGVTVQASPAQAGQTIVSATSEQIGSVYDVVVGGSKVRLYQYTAHDGSVYYTPDAPWGIGVQEHDTASGVQLDVSAIVNQAIARGGLTMDDPTKAVWFTVKDPQKDPSDPANQKYVYNPMAVMAVSDPIRAAAGFDPHTDSWSLTIAGYLGTPDGVRQLTTRVSSEADFATALYQQAAQAAAISAAAPGARLNEAQLYARNLDQVNLFVGLSGRIDSPDFSVKAASMWNKEDTTPTFAGLTSVTTLPTAVARAETARVVDTTNIVPVPPAGVTTSRLLASDQVRNDPNWSLGDLFQAGTNLLLQVNAAGEPPARGARPPLPSIKLPPVQTPTPVPTPTAARTAPTIAAPTVPAISTPPPPTQLATSGGYSSPIAPISTASAAVPSLSAPSRVQTYAQ